MAVLLKYEEKSEMEDKMRGNLSMVKLYKT